MTVVTTANESIDDKVCRQWRVQKSKKMEIIAAIREEEEEEEDEH